MQLNRNRGHFHLHVHPISKLKGHNIRAAAAYRRAERFAPEPQSVIHAAAYRRAQQLGNDGEVFDYRRKLGVAWTGIFAPEHTPAELRDAQTLWNTVERIEHRKNARLAREMIIALPHQVNQDVHIAMLRAFITAHLLSRGMIADVAIHRPPVEHGGDPRNWHAHVLLTDRPITPTGFAATKDRTWNARENVTALARRPGPTRTTPPWKPWACPTASITAAWKPSARMPWSAATSSPPSILTARRKSMSAAISMSARAVTSSRHAPGATNRFSPPTRSAPISTRIIWTAKLPRPIPPRTWKAWHMNTTKPHMKRSPSNCASNMPRVRGTHPPSTWADIQAAYLRPPSTTAIGKIKDAALAAEVRRRAMELVRASQHAWFPSGDRPGAPSIRDMVLPMVARTGPGHPVFTVTAKDLVFAFYNMGLTTLPKLVADLEAIAAEEQRLFQHRSEIKRKRQPPPQLKPPILPTPAANRLKQLRYAAVVPQQIYVKRLGQLNAANERYLNTALVAHRYNMNSQALGLRRRMTSDPGSG